MQRHWGNIGSMLSGLSTIAVGALIRGPAIVSSWLDRRRTLLSWSPGGVET